MMSIIERMAAWRPRPAQLALWLVGAALSLHAGSSQAIITIDDPNRYVPDPAFYTGVAKLRITRTDGQIELCSGALVAPGDRVVTAAHCLASDDGKSARAVSVEISFDAVAGAPMVSRKFTWYKGWTGDPDTSGADVGVVMLPQAPPAGTQPYIVPNFSFENPLFVLLAGYGEIGKGGVDKRLPAGFLHVGGNHYDDPPPGFALGSLGEYHLYDFDQYEKGGGPLGEPGWVTYPGPPPSLSRPKFDFEFDGVWVDAEAITGHGDSGGPSIVDGIFIVGVHSWAKNGIGGDAILLDSLPADFVGAPGSYAGDVQVGRYADWIATAFDGATQPIPEPRSAALMVVGLAALVTVARQRINASVPRSSER